MPIFLRARVTAHLPYMDKALGDRKINKNKPDMVVHTPIPALWEAEAIGSL